jgi:hypothetical protein
MLEQAENAAWDEVSTLEANRSELLEAFFWEPVQAEIQPDVSEVVRSIIAIDQIILELGRAEKLDLEESLMQIDRGKKAIKAYSS